MKNLLILDDDKTILDFISDLISSLFENEFLIYKFNSAESAIKKMEEIKFDLLLLDVEFENNDNVFNYPKLVNSSILKIFITGHKNYAYDAIKIKAFDFITKPINIQEFQHCIQQVINKINSDKPKVNELIQDQLQSLQINDLNNIHLIKINSIVSLKSEGTYTIFYLDNKSEIVSSKNLKVYEEKLSNYGFFRVHNTHVINCLKITSINKQNGFEVEMMDNSKIPISTRKKEDFLEYITLINH
jgi:two-component system, LytTR family, response regulator